ncbi:MAG: hypothetical protein IJK90_01265 [Bacteroidales bacterium]|jgi:hypothetical protein|nr:hypothetical protein [Bacteroidales bacterium]MBR6211423.1 hypothetical protein [Bacteroidales bacterium]
MIKKILLTSLIVLFSAGLLGCWFYFVGSMSAQGRGQAVCRNVEVILLDSLESAIVDRAEVTRQMEKAAIGRRTVAIDLDSIEKRLRARGEVMSAQVFTPDEGTLAVEITQRKPIIRFEKGGRRWYADPEGYLFPVTNSVDVPIVTGNIPIHADSTYRGAAPEHDREWILGMVSLARYIDERPFLRREIAQIDIAGDGDIMLYTRTPGPAIIFGDYGDCENKFTKLETWWKNILPEVGERKYRTINLKYNNQIICKQL